MRISMVTWSHKPATSPAAGAAATAKGIPTARTDLRSWRAPSARQAACDQKRRDRHQQGQAKNFRIRRSRRTLVNLPSLPPARAIYLSPYAPAGSETASGIAAVVRIESANGADLRALPVHVDAGGLADLRRRCSCGRPGRIATDRPCRNRSPPIPSIAPRLRWLIRHRIIIPIRMAIRHRIGIGETRTKRPAALAARAGA
jgi:hypothetical protein